MPKLGFFKCWYQSVINRTPSFWPVINFSSNFLLMSKIDLLRLHSRPFAWVRSLIHLHVKIKIIERDMVLDTKLLCKLVVVFWLYGCAGWKSIHELWTLTPWVKFWKLISLQTPWYIEKVQTQRPSNWTTTKPQTNNCFQT